MTSTSVSHPFCQPELVGLGRVLATATEGVVRREGDGDLPFALVE